MVDWIAAYNRLYKFLDSYTGSQFIKIVQETDPDLYDYNDYMQRRRDEEKSTTKKTFSKDIIMSYPNDVKHYLFEVFLNRLEDADPIEAKNIRSILKGDKVDINRAIYAKALTSKEIDENLIVSTIYGLEEYPEALRVYKQALFDYNAGKNERHTLDDLRLSLEIFLRQLLNNNKTLENQAIPLNQYQNTKGISKEVSSTFHKVIDLFSKYQNSYVKHNDAVKREEVEFIFNLTNTLFRFLLAKK